MRFDGGCHIDGVVHGNVIAERDEEAFLSISEVGRVEGNVRVPRVMLSGTVEGDVHASERVELGPTARVVGNVYYELLEMAAGAEINGQLIRQPDMRVPAASTPSPVPPHDATQPVRPRRARAVAAKGEG
ncbi:MAG TPA: polymer-forming cytoskeletal protein [Chromatiales bacterium]|nr:polymer-forming cytoskeletal protein [Chromatiales bacterium]